MTTPPANRPRRLFELARLFLRLGLTAFGGPAAHIAMLHNETTRRRRWLTDEQYLDLVGATNLIPGPNSTEMAIHIGYLRAGWPGLVVGGLCFILPAMLMVLGLAWAYVEFGSLPQAEQLLYGVKPVVIAVIAAALWSLGKRAVRGPLTAVVGLAVLMLYLSGSNAIYLLFGGALSVMVATNLQRLRRQAGALLALPGLAMGNATWIALAAAPFSLSLLFITFLKIGAVLYGSGYVLLAFLRADFVVRLGWLTDQQLIDAVAVGQVTPGPVFTTATFVGYLLGGLPGALVGTLGIFLPSFVLVAISNPLIPRMRNSPWISGLLDGANVAALGLMAAVTWQLGRASLTDLPTVMTALIALALLIRFKVSSVWLVAGGAAMGLLQAAI